MTFLFGDEHVQRYRETDGEEGHVWREGSTILLLTTKGRKTGLDRKGGAPDHPAGSRTSCRRRRRRFRFWIGTSQSTPAKPKARSARGSGGG